jgi:predicted kinase
LIHLNPDHYLQTDSGRVFTPERNAAAWEKLYLDLDAALRHWQGNANLFVVVGVQGSGKSTWIVENGGRLGERAIFVDAALPGVRHRARILSFVNAAAIPATAVWLNVPLETALHRNSLRSLDEQVPDDVIQTVFSHFEPPTLDEGFAEIRQVKK